MPEPTRLRRWAARFLMKPTATRQRWRPAQLTGPIVVLLLLTDGVPQPSRQWLMFGALVFFGIILLSGLQAELRPLGGWPARHGSLFMVGVGLTATLVLVWSGVTGETGRPWILSYFFLLGLYFTTAEYVAWQRRRHQI
jgi:hypothetical protein